MKNILIFIFITFLSSVYAQKTEHRNLEKKLAIQGYDPVSYLEEKKSVKGRKEFAAEISGVLYYTSSARNRELLIKNPQKYEPAYGGWCAYAMGDEGKKVEVNPNTFKIINNRTHLFYNKYFSNTLNSWNKNEAALKRSADQNWKRLTEK